MSRQRKYPKTTGYWVYAHRTPDNMYYPGQSNQQPSQRWCPSNYRNTVLHPYIEQYGWDNIEHLVVKDGLTKEQALYWEDQLIQMYTQMGCCINHQRSGNIYKNDIKAYKRQYNQRPEVKERKRQYMREYNQQPEYKEYQRQYKHRPEWKEYRRQYDQQRNQQPDRKIYSRVKDYNRHHTPIETPMEAKNKYLEYGYIPSYIKNDDLF